MLYHTGVPSVSPNLCASLFQSNYPRYLTVVEQEKKYGDILQYECRQYTIQKPGEIIICPNNLIMVVGKDEKPVELIEECEHKVYRECNQEQKSYWERTGKPVLGMVLGAAKPLECVK